MLNLVLRLAHRSLSKQFCQFAGNVDSQFLLRRALLDNQETVSKAGVSHAQGVRKALAGQIGQVHRILKGLACVAADGVKYRVIDVDLTLSKCTPRDTVCQADAAALPNRQSMKW